MESNANDCSLSDGDDRSSFDNYDYDELYYDLCGEGVDAALDDCNLSPDDFKDLTTPSTENWNSFSSNDHPAVVTMDQSKTIQWNLAQDEIHHLKRSISHLLNKEIDQEVGQDEILLFILGPNSVPGRYLRQTLSLSEETYLRFMIIFLIQSGYKVSVAGLYDKNSLLKDKAVMPKEEYLSIWKMLATLKELPKGAVSTSRRDEPIWQAYEEIVNKMLKEISVKGRDGRISIALDDDKIWLNCTNSNFRDLFNLKFTRHAKPNRNGIIAHTAVSSGATFPLGIVFEKTKDSTVNCFKRLLDNLFDQGGQTNLRNVSIHSDRGYLIPSLVFEYLLSCGAEVVGTIKRIAQCWPFTYKQVLKEKDKRTLIDIKGAPTLFLKWCSAGPKRLFASAFRNGTKIVAMAISSIHNNHHWEGVIEKPSELIRYKEDDRSLLDDFFMRVDLDGSEIEVNRTMDAEASPEETSFIKSLFDIIEPYTLRQGKHPSLLN